MKPPPTLVEAAIEHFREPKYGPAYMKRGPLDALFLRPPTWSEERWHGLTDAQAEALFLLGYAHLDDKRGQCRAVLTPEGIALRDGAKK